MKLIRLIFESFRFAWHALKSNLLRTMLSLLGVTVGIFAIIAVFTMVDSLQKNVMSSLSFLGDKVIYVQKWPWGFGGPYPWWKYFNRPSPNTAEFRYLEKNLENATAVAILDDKSNVTIKYKGNSTDGANVLGGSYYYNLITELPIVNGRYFSVQDVDAAREVALLGSEIATTLFPFEDPIGKTIKVRGNKFMVIGVIERQGESILDFGPGIDQTCYIPYGTFSKLFQNQKADPTIAVKGLATDEGLLELESEIRGLMRSRRGAKPLEEDDFAMNRPEMAANAFTSIFDVLNFAGKVIGGFSILVGGFGIANIMFVSVKERTNLIGIQKSLGAKNYFILCQFLFESVFLSLIGGLVGILLVFLITFIPLGNLEVVLSFTNIMNGLVISSVIGVLAGIIPAALAARLDPVIAIRSK